MFLSQTHRLFGIIQQQQVKPPEVEQESEPEEGVFGEWDSWENVPPAQPTAPLNSVPRNNYPSRQAVPEPEPEPEPDYFSDLGLAPTIKKSKKVCPITCPELVETLST